MIQSQIQTLSILLAQNKKRKRRFERGRRKKGEKSEDGEGDKQVRGDP